MEHFYSCEQVAERYGVKVATVWEWIRSKKLPAIKKGNGTTQQRIIDALERLEQRQASEPTVNQ